MLLLLMAAMSSVAPISLSAVWGNITGASGGGALGNANVTLTFSGGARDLRIDHDLAGSDFEYRINSGTYTNCPDETTFSVSSGDTVNFRVNSPGGEISGTVNVYDNTYYPSTILDQFTVSII